MDKVVTSLANSKPRQCSNCDSIFNIAELSDYLLSSDRKKLKCFDCKTYSRLKHPSSLKMAAGILWVSPLFFIAIIPTLIAIVLLIDYLGGNWSGKQVGIVFVVPACLAVTYCLSRYIMCLVRFYFYPLEPMQNDHTRK